MSRFDAAESHARAATDAEDTSQAIPAWLTRPAVGLPLILFAVVALYAPSMNDWFQTDDLLLLRAARVVPFWTYVREAFDFTDFEPLHFYAYRPLYFISSDVLYLTFGLHPAAYHGVALAFHLANVVLTFHVARKLTGSTWIGYGAAAIFGLHPVYYITVAWISGLNSVVATTGQLACTALLLAYDQRRRWHFLAGALTAYGVALLFHQEIFVAPAVVLTYLVVRRPLWWKSLFSTRTVVPFALFGVVLLLFLVIQGQATQEAGFLDNFLPGGGTLRLLAGTLAISVIPSDDIGFGFEQYLLALVMVLIIGIVTSQRGVHRGTLLFGVTWYASLLVLSMLFFDDTPVTYMQIVIARKIYSAGPAIGLIGAVSVATLWNWPGKHLSSAIMAAAIGIAIVGVPSFVVLRVRNYQELLERTGNGTQQFHDALAAEHLTVPQSGGLYIAGAPFSMIFPPCPGTLCYLSNLVAVVYGRDIEVHAVTKVQAQDPTFLATLGPNDRVFCYQC